MTAEAGIWALVPAAGSGTRMQAGMPKQYLPLRGRPILLHTLERLCSFPRLRGVLVGLAAADSHWRSLDVTPLSKLAGTFDGGSSRAQTVLNGLQALATRAGDDDWIMVHDAVRPCVRHSDLAKLVAATANHADGALLALPLIDTLKRTDATGGITGTIPRTALWRALTPQMFRVGQLRQALSAALMRGEEITDESAAIECAGGRPLVVEGRPDNIKITLPADLALAELYLKQQLEEGA
ncbi:MAG: 2-C-methyl-D-erythritol 4-phosphate cytidylyltransferase [Gammaproteobacteria bacterium]|nr:2-C-methyl-D-erythritol 4-phosphate cytidylyltransferase [Gammaproteobacteria bacterium]